MATLVSTAALEVNKLNKWGSDLLSAALLQIQTISLLAEDWFHIIVLVTSM